MHDIVIIGGGLSGLSCAIQLSKSGFDVVLIEKKQYPFHRVCGEYISMETIPFLERELDFNPFDYGAVKLDFFNITSPKGTLLELSLDLGGFGLSRYRLDDTLKSIAEQNGASIFQKTNVLDVIQHGDFFEIKTNKQAFKSKMVIGAFGKRSNLDRQLNRKTFYQRSPYIGVKHHIKIDGLMPENYIALHNFKDGYCGISRVEDETFCLCYLSHKRNIQQQKTVLSLEKNILQSNPTLNRIFNEAEFIWEKPLVINEVSFAPKSLQQNGIWMCGDTAGMIAPLCGNGMAMAFHSSFLLSNALKDYLSGKVDKETAFKYYQKKWKKHFSMRLMIGRNIQKMFGSELLSEMMIRPLKQLPFLTNQLIKLTHGKHF